MMKSNNKISDFLYYKNVKCNLHYCSIAKARCLDYSLNFVLILSCFMIDIKLFFLIVYRSYELFFVLCYSDNLDLFFSNFLLRLLLFFATTFFFSILFCRRSRCQCSCLLFRVAFDFLRIWALSLKMCVRCLKRKLRMCICYKRCSKIRLKSLIVFSSLELTLSLEFVSSFAIAQVW